MSLERCDRCNNQAFPAIVEEFVATGVDCLPGHLAWKCPSCDFRFVRQLNAHNLDSIKNWITTTSELTDPLRQYIEKQTGITAPKPWWSFLRRNPTNIFNWFSRKKSKYGTNATNLGSPALVPMIFSMKAFNVRYYPSCVTSPKQFSKTTSLLKGKTAFPNRGAATRRNTASGKPSLSKDQIYSVIVEACDKWPEDVCIAFRGLCAFGTGDHDLAFQCARLSLQKEKECLLARQLMELLSDTTEHRIKSANPAGEQSKVYAAMAKANQIGNRLIFAQLTNFLS